MPCLSVSCGLPNEAGKSSGTARGTQVASAKWWRPFLGGGYILDYTTNENIVPILEAIQAQSKTEFLIRLHSGIRFLLQQRVALVLA